MLDINCVFCKIIRKESPAEIIKEWSNALAFKPLNPVTDGHILVIPKFHVRDFRDILPEYAGSLFGHVIELTNKNNCYNLITSAGSNATQTVFHLHWHIVPRRKDDDLPLPWTTQL